MVTKQQDGNINFVIATGRLENRREENAEGVRKSYQRRYQRQSEEVGERLK